MEHSPWQEDSSSASQAIESYGAWEVHYCVYNSPTPAPILSQVNPIDNLPSYV